MFVEGHMTTNSDYDEPDWLVAQRVQARKSFDAVPLPRLKYGLTIKIDLDDFSFEKCASASVPEQTIVVPKGVIVLDLADAVQQYPTIKKKFLVEAVPPTTKFELFTAAEWKKTTVVIIPQDLVVVAPLEIHTVGKDTNVENLLVIAEPNSSITIIDSITNSGTHPIKLHCKIVEVFAEAGARVNMLCLQNCDETTNTFITKRAITENDAQVNWLDCHFGSGVSVSETATTLKGRGSHTNNYGIFFGRGNQKFDVHAKSVHVAPETSSDLLTKGVLDDAAKAIYRGVLKIEPTAFGASGYQKEEVTLLSPKAEADSIPELRINNNDIKKCTHGASIGQVDAERLFYLMSRGFTKMDATKKLIEGFFAALLQKASTEKFSEELQKLIEAKLAK